MRFNYQARTRTGEIQTGIVEASNREAAFNILKSHDLYVTILEEKEDSSLLRKELKIFQGVTRKDVVVFSRQASIMLKANVPIVESFRTIAQQTKKAGLKEKIMRIAEEVEAGNSLSQALSLYPKNFTPFYINMVRSGEVSGKLSEVFEYLADYLEKEQNFRGKIIGAMVYPIFVFIVFIAVMLLIMLYIIPQLASVLKETGQELPMITQIIISMSEFLKRKGWWIFLTFIALIVAFFQFIKTKKGKAILDNFLLKIPFLSSFLKKLYLARFALNLSTLISGGLPIVRALEITGMVVGNNCYQKIIEETMDKVKKGNPISSVLEKYPAFIFPLFYQMVAVGERTGTLDSSLKNVVNFYQREVDRGLDSLVRILEPLLIILLGGGAAVLIASVLLPIYSTGFSNM